MNLTIVAAESRYRAMQLPPTQRVAARITGLLLLSCLVTAWPTPTLAQSPADQGDPDGTANPPRPGVAVTQLTTHGILPVARSRLVKSVEGGLAAAGLKVVGLAAVTRTLSAEQGLAGCETSVCLQRIARLTRAALCARATVEKTGDAYRLEVTVSLGRTGQAVVTRERRCAPCNLNEATDTLARAAREAAAGTLEKNVLPRPRPRIRRPPPRPDRRRRAPGVKITPGPDPKVRIYNWVGIGGLIAGGLALIPGVVLLAIHGKNSQDPSPTQNREIYDTQVGGAILAGLGAAALVGGAVLLTLALLRGQEQPGRTTAAIPCFAIGAPRHGRGVVLHGEFRF